MNAMTPPLAPHGDSPASGATADAVHRMEIAWFALHRAGEAVAGLAGDIAQESPEGIGEFPTMIHRAGGWRLRQAEQGIADLSAIMQSGLAALLSVRERGAETGPAAQALLREFSASRDALIDLARPVARIQQR